MMKLTYKHFLAALVLLFSFQTLQAQSNHEVIEKVDISKLDRYYTSHHAQKRTFKTKRAFKHVQARHTKPYHSRTIAPVPVHHNRYRLQNKWYDNNRYYNGERYYGRYIPKRQFERAHRYSRRGWVLAYRYDRAGFFDRDGFYYGYFNRYGYFFEGVFYRYDYSYTYRDRVRGRGLFDRYYYRPAAWREYGFCR